MLSLMYGGELCYWHSQLSAVQETLHLSDAPSIASLPSKASGQAGDFSASLVMDALIGGTFVEQWRLQFDAKMIGEKFLKKYVDTVRNSMQGIGWDCRRAEELLLLLK